MDHYFNLMLIGSFVLFLFMIHSLLKKRKTSIHRFQEININAPKTQDDSKDCTIHLSTPPQSNPSPTMLSPDLLIINLFAKAKNHFASYDLLQAISNTGMHYGEMNIFHYYVATEKSKKPLFSLASATEPGEFNLDRIGEFSCAGLTFFMDLKKVAEPHSAFKKMLLIAEQLAEDLEGDLFNASRLPLNKENLQTYYEKIMEYKIK